jgi:hypothetical protein
MTDLVGEESIGLVPKRRAITSIAFSKSTVPIRLGQLAFYSGTTASVMGPWSSRGRAARPLQSFRLPGALRSSAPLNNSPLSTCLSIRLGKGVVLRSRSMRTPTSGQSGPIRATWSVSASRSLRSVTCRPPTCDRAGGQAPNGVPTHAELLLPARDGAVDSEVTKARADCDGKRPVHRELVLRLRA